MWAAENPLCGDLVGLALRLRDGVIEEVAFHGHGCAISQAALADDRAAEGAVAG